MSRTLVVPTAARAAGWHGAHDCKSLRGAESRD